MNTRLCQKIAERMQTLLQTEVGERINTQRLLSDSLYARDVLLVCDAVRDSELPRLARHFRDAQREQPKKQRPVKKQREASGLSNFLNSIFGSPSIPPDIEAARHAASRTHFAPSRTDPT